MLDTARFAGFWVRFVAIFIDGLILAPLLYGLDYLGFRIFMTGESYGEYIFGPQTVDPVFGTVPSVVEATHEGMTAYLMFGLASSILVSLFYTTVMHASPKQATLGKMAMGVQVVDRFGGRLTWKRSLGRHAATYLSGLILNIGYLMAAFDAEKQALHDKLADTYVVYKR